MTAIDFSSHAVNPAAQGPATAITSAQSSDSSGFSFGDLLDIINPLQHIPVVSTIYRAITGDQIGTPEKIAGDTLYGGVIGFIASVADSAFQAITGKNVGDTVLAFLEGDGATQTTSAPTPTNVASAQTGTASAAAQPSTPPATVTPASAVSAPDISALLASLSRKGVDADMATRAAYAYRQAIGLTAPAQLTPAY
ncbi:MAG: hypothetical protein KGL56_01385 [Alphaproteobacteria bacterium]|nr:hypothetical protein [Alphaproteobacteria bacterium]MDE2161580.1 hypothetical protein [Alphaproteobacteria bacterium]MDE2498817.1 hypothetical protein [Alphaproteobacteria bacterium]